MLKNDLTIAEYFHIRLKKYAKHKHGKEWA